MNMSLKSLKDVKVNDFIRIHDYYQMVTNKYILSIYNPIQWDLCKGGFKEFNSEDASCLINKIVSNISYEDEKSIVIELEEYEISISLQEKDYTGPEAVSIRFSDGTIIVI